MIHIIYFNSCLFHHRVYYELRMVCSPVGLISSMYSVASGYRKGQNSIPDQAWIFSGSFSTTQVGHGTSKVLFTFISLSAVQNIAHFIDKRNWWTQRRQVSSQKKVQCVPLTEDRDCNVGKWYCLATIHGQSRPTKVYQNRGRFLQGPCFSKSIKLELIGWCKTEEKRKIVSCTTGVRKKYWREVRWGNPMYGPRRGAGKITKMIPRAISLIG